MGKKRSTEYIYIFNIPRCLENSIETMEQIFRNQFNFLLDEVGRG